MCDPDDDWSAWDLLSGLDPMASIEVEVTPNEIVAVLEDVDGVPLIEIRERPVIPFGFTR